MDVILRFNIIIRQKICQFRNAHPWKPMNWYTYHYMYQVVIFYFLWSIIRGHGGHCENKSHFLSKRMSFLKCQSLKTYDLICITLYIPSHNFDLLWSLIRGHGGHYEIYSHYSSKRMPFLKCPPLKTNHLINISLYYTKS